MHSRTVSGALIAFLGLTVALFHYLANAFYLYFALWWADIVMHFLGGLLVSSFVLWLIRFEIPISIRNRVPVFATTFVAIILAGVSWEVFERVFGIYSTLNYQLDTAMDLAMNVVGMLTAYLAFKRYVL